MAMIKTKKELQMLRKSAAVSNSCIPLIEKSLKENISERELARRIRRKINSQGATLAFQTLVASGKRTSMIHPHPHSTNEKIRGIGYVDFGASYRGYKTDVTVPFVKGSAGKKEWKIIKTGLAAYRLAVKSVKIWKQCWLVHKKTDLFLRKNGFKMLHSLGHGLGKEIHERPLDLNAAQKTERKETEKMAANTESNLSARHGFHNRAWNLC